MLLKLIFVLSVILILPANKNYIYGTDAGKATQDKVFLLSISEVRKYFNSDDSRKCSPTDYADENGTFQEHGICRWWLRSPGNNQDRAAYVSETGKEVDIGGMVNWSTVAVRPAMWIDIS